MLTILFVMLAEVFVYAPSIGRFRLDYLQERIASAHLAILALEATPDNMVSDELEERLLTHVGARSIALSRPGRGKLMLMTETPRSVDTMFDLRKGSFFGLIGNAFSALFHRGERTIRVSSPSPKEPEMTVELVIDEKPLYQEMLDFSWRILALSLLISIFTAALVYLSLHLLLVRPLLRIADGMAAFRKNPEDASHVLPATSRSDEIGLAQRELAHMQEGLRTALLQKTRLAALGTAVTKIHHDLRNILSTASLVSDRLTTSDDPKVRQMAPTLVASIDKAVKLCGQTLAFARETPTALQLTNFDLSELVEEVCRQLQSEQEPAGRCVNAVPEGMSIQGDREQLYRVLQNLIGNAWQAGAREVGVSARGVHDYSVIRVGDDGPGIPETLHDKLFTPFHGSTKRGGTGLGLSIARDIMRSHGGDIRLDETSAAGTVFALVLPSRGSGAKEWRDGSNAHSDLLSTGPPSA